MLPLLRLSVPARPEGIGHRHHGGEYGVQDEAVRGDGVGGFSVGQEKVMAATSMLPAKMVRFQKLVMTLFKCSGACV